MKLAHLGDVATFEGGSQPAKSNFIYEEKRGYVRFIQIRDFKSEKNLTYIPESKKNRLCEEGDILIGRYGASVGQILTGLRGAYNVALIKASPNESLVLRKFFYYYLNSELFQSPLLNISKRSAQSGFTKEEISSFIIPLPSISQQRLTIEKLDKAFIEIDSLEKNLQLKEEKTNQLLQSMLSAAFTNTEEFAMKIVKLGEICELISRGISPTYCDNSDLIVINQRCIRDNEIDLTFSKFHNENLKKVNETKFLKYNDGLINSTGVGTLGRTATFAIENKFRYTVDSHVTIARPKLDQLDPGYFKLMLKSLETKFVELATGTSGQTELPRENLNNIEVIVCEKKEDQRKLAVNILNSFVEIDKLKNQISTEKERISSLRQSILSNAFNFEEKAA
jgi:type I restriction enzyme S subunit